MYTTPFKPSAGKLTMPPPKSMLQAVAPVLVFNAYKYESDEPTYTNPVLLTLGEPSTESPVSLDHTTLPDDGDKQYKYWLPEPTNTLPLDNSTAGDDRTGLPV